MTKGSKPEIYTAGKVLESIPPKRSVLTRADLDDAADQSRVTEEYLYIHNELKSGRKTMHGRPAALRMVLDYLK